MSHFAVDLSVTTTRDSISMRRSGEAASHDAAAPDALSRLIELADEAFGHYAYRPLFTQAVALDALLDGEPVHPDAEGDLVDRVRDLLARVAWAEDPANWTIVNAGTGERWTDDRSDDSTADELELRLRERPADWTPSTPAPEEHPDPAQSFELPADAPWATPELRAILSGKYDLSDPAVLADLDEQAVRLAGAVARQQVRATFPGGSPEPGPSVLAVRRVGHIRSDDPLDILYVREFDRWRAEGADGDGKLYDWSAVVQHGELVDASDEHRYGVRDDLSGRLVFDRVRLAADPHDPAATFEVATVAEGWRTVRALHEAATPPQIMARRAAKAAQR
jgi:hypothetical protein